MWEPEEHIPTEIVQSFDLPIVPTPLIESARDDFLSAFQARLGQRTSNHFYIFIQLHLFRYLFQNKGFTSAHGVKLYQKGDFELLELPNNWDKLTYSEKGDGRHISLPIEMKPGIKWSRKHYILESGKLISGPRRPIEMIKIDFSTERLECIELA
jgi:hypothetical protein